MISYTYSLFNRLLITNGRRTVLTAATKELQNTNVSHIIESNPIEHDESYLNQIYRVPLDVTKSIQPNLPMEVKHQINIFREFSILIRKPSIEVISYLEQADYTKSINKYVLYGEVGTGKTMTLIHLIHYGISKQFIVLHLPWVCTWFRYAKDVIESPVIPDKLDLPMNAMEFLKHFKAINDSLLSKLDLKVSKEYKWTEREITKVGDSLSDLVEFGIQRTKFSCGVIDALVDELKIASTAGKCRTLVIIDGFNAFTSKHTLIRDGNRVFVPPERISITSTFLKSVDYNWCNGAAILTVDIKANKERREYNYPAYLLGKKGFEHLDPFVPICAENYSPEEFHTILNYYNDRKWIRNISPQGKKELELLTNRNPMEVWTRCKPL